MSNLVSGASAPRLFGPAPVGPLPAPRPPIPGFHLASSRLFLISSSHAPPPSLISHSP